MYDKTRKERLPKVLPVLVLRPYLEVNQFSIRTDHNCLKWISILADAHGRLGRWHLHLLKFEFDVVHRAVVKHQAANALSRMPADITDTAPIEYEMPIAVIDTSSKIKYKITLQYPCCQINAQVIEGNDGLQKR